MKTILCFRILLNYFLSWQIGRGHYTAYVSLRFLLWALLSVRCKVINTAAKNTTQRAAYIFASSSWPTILTFLFPVPQFRHFFLDLQRNGTIQIEANRGTHSSGVSVVSVGKPSYMIQILMVSVYSKVLFLVFLENR